MKTVDRRSRKAAVVGAAIGALCVSGLLASSAAAAVVHQYTFNTGDASDSVGGANGTLSNGATVNATSLVTSGAGAGIGLSQNATLPAGAVAGLGTYSLEQFYTRNAAGGNFQTLFGFAVGADAAAQQNNYLVATPNRNSATGQMSVAYKQAGFNLGAERLLQGPTAIIGQETYLANTYDVLTGQATLHVDGAMRDGFQANYFAGFSLAGKNARMGINGNAAFGDPSLNGSTNEFRLYDNVESASTIALRFLGGNTLNNAVTVNASNASGDYATSFAGGAPTAAQHATVTGNTLDVTTGTNTAGLLTIGGGGVVNVNGGTLTSATNIDLRDGGVINLNTGGTLAVKGLSGQGQAYATSGGGTVNLNGGTLTGVAAAQANQGYAYLASPNVTLNSVSGSTTTVNTSTGRITIASTITGSGTIAQTTSNDLFLQGNISGFTGTYNIAPAAANGGVTIFAPVARTSANPIASTFTLNNFGFVVFSGQNSDYVTGNITGGINGTSIRKNDFGTLTFANNSVAVNGEIVANGRTSLAFLNSNVTVGSATNPAQIGLLDNGIVGEVRKITLSNSTVNSLNAAARYLFIDTGGNQETRYLELLGGATLGDKLPLFTKGRATQPAVAGFGFTDANRTTSGLIVDNVAGNNAINGGISIRAPGGGQAIRVQSGTLTVAGNSYNNVASSNRSFELIGPSNGVFSGTVNDGTGTAMKMSLTMIGQVTNDGLTTTGAGSWSLNSLNNTFSGGLQVVNGKFFVNGSTTSASTEASNAVNVYGGTLGGTGSIAQSIVVHAAGSTVSRVGGAIDPLNNVAETLGKGGTISPGNDLVAIATLTAGKGVTINGAFDAQADGAGGGTSDKLAVGTTLTLGSASTLNFSNIGAGALDDGAYVIASYAAGGLTGTFNTLNLPAGMTVDYNYAGGNQIAVVPEPATLAAIGGLASLMLGRRRRA